MTVQDMTQQLNLIRTMVCFECGKVMDLHTDSLASFIEQVQEETDFDIYSEKVYFYGICKNCRDKK